MRSVRLLLVALAVATALPGGVTAQAAGAMVDMDVKFGKNVVEVVAKMNATDALMYPYTARYEITGTISGPDYTTTVSLHHTVIAGNPGSPPFVRHHYYPMFPASEVRLAYSIRLLAASGAPVAYCEGTTSRTYGGGVTTITTC